MRTKEQVVTNLIRIFTDGSGCRPDGKGSGYAWLRQDTGEQKVVREDGLTNNQAEYRAILAAVQSLPVGTNAEICSDSENTCFQLMRRRRILDPRLFVLAEKIESVVVIRKLSVSFVWIPRRENLAGKLL